ncbi:fumarylacetoacetate hydrolase family protein [Streptomyces sp. NPDC048430]|uniref:2-keto-4-pentenoate hydratase n=1 Tax=Streptomyces sp. NPDC048430 TaxID=3155388 RepID=UPI003421539C
MNNPIAVAAARLQAAASDATPCAPVRDLIGPSSAEAAYSVQQRVAEARPGLMGRKIGLTSAAVQQQLGVDQPDFGLLFADMAVPNGGTVPRDRLLQPRVEAEVAFVLRDDLADGELTLDQVRDAAEYAVAAIEICDSRIAGWDISFADTVADNASAGLFVLGEDRRSLTDFTPRDVTMAMTINDVEQSTGTGAACLGDPLLAVQWLAREARRFGQPLRAGQVILSGALGPMRPVQPGDVVRATISGLGTVSVTFEKD